MGNWKMLKKLSNFGEHRVYGQIAPVAERYDAEVYRKIRLADVVDIDQLGTGTLRKYALMAHLDFVVSDNEHTPHFAVEFDGPGHSPANDGKKDEICRQGDIALFRVNLPTSRSQVRRLTFLNYLVHLWFLGHAFEDMRANGEVPADEAFMMSGFLKSDAKHIFDSEFDLIGPARANIDAFCEQENICRGALTRLSIGELLMRSESGQYIAFCGLPMGNTKLYGRNALGLKVPNYGRLREVPFASHEIGQYCLALAMRDLLEELKVFHAGSGHVARRQSEVRDEIDALRQRGFRPLLALSGPDDELARLAEGKSQTSTAA